MNPSEHTSRIVRNTTLLYGRMAVTMLVALWAESKVLGVLGPVDNNVYAVVGSFTALFWFLNTAMASATQRFLNVEMERGGGSVRAVFSASLTVHACIAAAVLLLGETVGLWAVQKWLVFPPERWQAALWVYHFSLLTSCLNIVRVPYNALIVASERMSTYAFLTIAEAVLRLGAVFSLIWLGGDKLIIYSVLICGTVGLVTLAFVWWCRRRFGHDCRWQRPRDGVLVRRMVGFSGWSLLGSGAGVASQHGVNLLFNIMVVTSPLNVAIEKAQKLASSAYGLVLNFQTAFNPQIMKSWAVGDVGYFRYLIFRASKYSYFLLLLIALPFVVCAEPLIGLWLAPNAVPAHTAAFAQLLMCFLLVDALAGPLWSAVQATGRIRGYQILMSSLILLSLPAAWLCLRAGWAPEWALAMRVFVNVVCLGARIWWLRRHMAFPAGRYAVSVLGVVFLVTLLAATVPWLLLRWDFGAWWAAAAAAVWTPLVIFAVGMRRSEREFIFKKVWRKK